MKKRSKVLGAQMRLRKLRDDRKLTQADFAHAIGMSASHYAHLEKAEYVTDGVLQKAAAVFHADLDWLRTGAGKMNVDRDMHKLLLNAAGAGYREGLSDARQTHVAEPASPKYGSPPGQITMAQAMEAIATQLALPVEKVREAVTGLLKSENDPPKKKG